MKTKNEKGSVEFQKMSRMAVIASVVIGIILVVGIVISIVAGLKQTNNDTEFENTTATDTTAPKVTMEQRYIFTNDMESLTDLTSMIKEVKDASDYTLKLVRFEKKEALKVLNDIDLKNLTEGADSFVSKDTALQVGSEEIPTEAGIYRSILEIKDACGNASYEEVYVILDQTAASINEVPDQVIEVAKENLSAEPELDKTLYKALDNVDGEITFSELTTELVLRDEAKHEWLVKVSYTDRAGNTSADEFLITVVEQSASSGNGGSNNGSGNTNPQTGTKPNNNPGTSGNQGNTGTTYHPADTNKDGDVSASEEMRYITPEKQACIDAGYGVVVEMEGGKWYAILMKNADHKINGKHGWEILTDYLHERGLDGTVGGCWINMDNEWYWYTAQNIHEWEGEYGEIIW